MEDMTMKLEDIIALAKAGYKPSDIKELVKLAEEPQEPQEPQEVQEVQTQPIEENPIEQPVQPTSECI